MYFQKFFSTTGIRMLQPLLYRLLACCPRPLHRTCSVMLGNTQIASILSGEFNPEQENQILNLLNTIPAPKLREIKYLTSQKAMNLVKYRDEHGDFTNLSDILAVPGFGVLGVKRIAKAILNNETTNKKRDLSTEAYRTRSSICHPRLLPEKCQEIESVVALDIGQDAIFWVHMDRGLSVDDWHKTQVFTSPSFKYDHAEFHHNIHHALASIPEADAYVLENKIYRYQYLKIVPIIVSLRLMEAITITMLNQHHFTQFGQHCVYTLKPHAVSNFFNLIVGGERVSCQHVARDIINRCSAHADGVTVPDHLADYFFGLDHADQENLTRALLLSVLFYKKLIFPGSRNSA